MIGNFFAVVGRLILGFFAEFGRIIMLGWNVLRYTPRALTSHRLVTEQMAIIGVNALPLVILIGAFTGAIAALQATNLFVKFNLLEIAKPFIGGSISTVVFTELSPVLTALIIAGRIGGAIAAQIGTMQVSEQIDALEMMAIDPARYLAMPRVLAATLMMPVLIVFAHVVAIAGAFLLASLKFNLSEADFFGSIQNYFRISEIVLGLVKSLIFGGVTALIGCHVGFSTSGGAEGVGSSAVRSFTLSSAAILMIDALFGYVL
ncbi:MAG: ABC transporter permease [Candidatus Kapaibacterium sp.]